jgi:hypothetical protein
VRTSQVLPWFERPRAIDTIVYGGLVAGLLDVLDGVVIFVAQGRDPITWLQYVASGALGPIWDRRARYRLPLPDRLHHGRRLL